MKSRTSILIVIWACLASFASAQKLAKAGEKVPDFRFTRVILNGDGRATPEDFYGRPLLLEFWGFK